MGFHEDVQVIKTFLEDIRRLLQDIVDHPRPFIPGRHHDELRAAWDPSVKGKFDGAIGQLTDPPTVLEGSLFSDHGLTGAELAIKLRIFYQALDELRDEGQLRDYKDLKDVPLHPDLRRRTMRPLNAANVILDSLAQIIVMVGAIKEFKGTVEVGMDLMDKFRVEPTAMQVYVPDS